MELLGDKDLNSLAQSNDELVAWCSEKLRKKPYGKRSDSGVESGIAMLCYLDELSNSMEQDVRVKLSRVIGAYTAFEAAAEGHGSALEFFNDVSFDNAEISNLEIVVGLVSNIEAACQYRFDIGDDLLSSWGEMADASLRALSKLKADVGVPLEAALLLLNAFLRTVQSQFGDIAIGSEASPKAAEQSRCQAIALFNKHERTLDALKAQYSAQEWSNLPPGLLIRHYTLWGDIKSRGDKEDLREAASALGEAWRIADQITEIGSLRENLYRATVGMLVFAGRMEWAIVFLDCQAYWYLERGDASKAASHRRVADDWMIGEEVDKPRLSNSDLGWILPVLRRNWPRKSG